MRYIPRLIVMTIVLGLGLQMASANPVINEKDAPDFMYTLTAASGKMEGDRLTLNNVPLVVYFTDRPARITGQLSLEVFEQGWDQGPGSFRADPPNARLSIYSEGGAQTAVVELSEPEAKIKEDQISFKVRVLQGEVPESFGKATLFIEGSCSSCGGK